MVPINDFAASLPNSKIFSCRILAMWIALVALAGCVGAQVLPDAGTASRVKSIHIVPMESPPLTIDAAYAATGSASIVHFLPRYTIGMARTVGVLSGIVVLLELPEMMRARAKSRQSLQQQIEPTENWLISEELAQEASRLMAASSRSSTISTKIRPIPGVQDRERTALMENWMAPIRDWYNDKSPSTRYAALRGKNIDAVVEVGISNYEIYAGKLLLQVHAKLIDPASGQLLGRARASSFTDLPVMDEIFAAEAKRFKTSASHAGNQLIAKCLQDLNLL